MRKYRLRIGLDVDDTLYECNEYALALLRRRYGDLDALRLENIRGWGRLNTVADERVAYFGDPEFVRTQPLYSGAQDFVRALAQFADVFFVTAVPPACMSARAERLKADFPEVPVDNILIGTRKDVVRLDVLLDDAAHSIAQSPATYPVLMRRPWNTHLSGLLAVNGYDDFVHLAHTIADSFVAPPADLSRGGVVCLVGATGTGKNEIAEALLSDPRFYKPRTTTTRARLPQESAEAYRFVDEKTFAAERARGVFLETTVYGGYYFGTDLAEFAPVEEGRVAVLPIDICGAVTMKNRYRERALLVYTARDKRQVLLNILARPISDADKVNRLLALDLETRNVELCDLSVDVDQGLDKALAAILAYVGA